MDIQYTVITGDIVGFTRISQKKRENLMSETEKLVSSWVKKPADAGIFRGDSFQLLFDNTQEALFKSLSLRCWFKKNEVSRQKAVPDARMAIGIGSVSYHGKSVLDSDGEAFHLSGRAFDAMANDQYLRIVTSDKTKNEQLDTILTLANLIISGWTANQAAVIYLLLEGKTQQQMAVELHIAQSAVNNRLKLAKWKEIEKTFRYIVALIES